MQVSHFLPTSTPPSEKLQLEGARLFDEGKFPQAYVAFLAAWGVSKLPSIAANQISSTVPSTSNRYNAKPHEEPAPMPRIKSTKTAALTTSQRRATPPSATYGTCGFRVDDRFDM